jgi:dTDP-4-dehydrorhamnose reductase
MTHKKRIIVLGIAGMLGSAVHKYLLETKKYNVYGTSRSTTKETLNIIKFSVNEKGHIEEIIGWIRPDYVINCIGAIPQTRPEILDYFHVNFELPSNIVKTNKTTLIQPSTDCIFSGERLPGQRLFNFYNKEDYKIKNYSKDPYGISKRIFDEAYEDDCIILRGSILGPSFGKKGFGLFDWIESQKNK